MGFEPRIVGIFCNWCTYTGADLAGTSRLKYPANIRVVRVMCSGRMDPTLVIKAITEGADGVLLAGCHPGDCHYQNGNMKTMRRVPLLKKTLEQLGLEPGRVRLEWISASEGIRFQEVVKEFIEQIRELGPLQLKGGIRRSPHLEARAH
jgi:F420-non-reducing hydrogenase iron-sulfur subunit